MCTTFVAGCAHPWTAELERGSSFEGVANIVYIDMPKFSWNSSSRQDFAVLLIGAFDRFRIVPMQTLLALLKYSISTYDTRRQCCLTVCNLMK